MILSLIRKVTWPASKFTWCLTLSAASNSTLPEHSVHRWVSLDSRGQHRLLLPLKRVHLCLGQHLAARGNMALGLLSFFALTIFLVTHLFFLRHFFDNGTAEVTLSICFNAAISVATVIHSCVVAMLF